MFISVSVIVASNDMIKMFYENFYFFIVYMGSGGHH